MFSVFGTFIDSLILKYCKKRSCGKTSYRRSVFMLLFKQEAQITSFEFKALTASSLGFANLINAVRLS